MDVGANTASNSAANYLLEGLHEVGIDYLFCNMGTDHAPIIEAMAGRRKRGQSQPKVIVCPHENTAAHMAGGYALATGRGQGVLVHVDVGTANTTNTIINKLNLTLNNTQITTNSNNTNTTNSITTKTLNPLTKIST